MQIKIAITDDHTLILEGLRNILDPTPDMEITGMYLNGDELLSGLTKTQPDILLLDINMPGKTGQELAKEIKLKYPEIAIIALTNLDNIYHIKTMLEQGVYGYIMKDAKKDVLIEAIRTVYGGKQFFDETVKERIAEDRRTLKKITAHSIHLTRRETEVLQLIAGSNTSQEIAKKLFLSKRTIDHHRESIMMKLDVKNTPALIKKAIELGLIN